MNPGVPSEGAARTNRPIARSVFVGRDDVMARLGAVVKQAALGRGSTLVIRGDAGVGKSRVTLELEAVALTAGFRTLRGTCYPGDRAVPSAA